MGRHSSEISSMIFPKQLVIDLGSLLDSHYPTLLVVNPEEAKALSVMCQMYRLMIVSESDLTCSLLHLVLRVVLESSPLILLCHTYQPFA